MNNKFSQLPANVLDFLSSDFVIDLNREIIKQYRLGGSENLIGIVNGLFFKDFNFDNLISVVVKDFNLDKRSAENLALDIVGRYCLIFDAFFAGRASRFILDNGRKIIDYKSSVDAWHRVAAKLIEERVPDESVTSVEEVVFKEVNEESEKKAATDVFQKNIVDFLTANGSEFNLVLDDYNGVLLILLDKDKNFKKSLEEALYINQQVLTSRPIKIGGKELAPTVANWLADFIAFAGTDYFDAVKISDYLIKGENTKQLSEPDRALLTKLLDIYRKIKFFPQSFGNIPPERWQLLPLVAEAETPTNESTFITEDKELTALERMAQEEDSE